MRVSATFTRERATFIPTAGGVHGFSPLSSIQGRQRRRDNLLTLLFAKIRSFFDWILSFCIPAESTEEQRFQKIDLNGETIRYRIEGTENEVKLGRRCVRLDQLQLPDENEIEDLSELLTHILVQEGIDVIETHNLYHAWVLHRAGLKTQGQIPFVPGNKDPLNALILEVLKTAKDPSLVRGLEAKLILGIIADAVDKHNRLDREKARKQRAALEQLLGRELNLASLHVPISSHPHLVQLRGRPKGAVPADAGSYSLPINLLFSLIECSGKEIKKTMLLRLPLTKFTKG